MEPDHLKEFVNNPNGTRAEIEKKSPGIVERAEQAIEQKDDLSPKAVREHKARQRSKNNERERDF